MLDILFALGLAKLDSDEARLRFAEWLAEDKHAVIESLRKHAAHHSRTCIVNGSPPGEGPAHDTNLCMPAIPLRRALLTRFAPSLAASAVAYLLYVASNVLGTYELYLLLRWIVATIPARLHVDGELLVASGLIEAAPGAWEGVFLVFVIALTAVVGTLGEKCAVTVSQRAFLRMQAVLTALVVEHAAHCLDDDGSVSALLTDVVETCLPQFPQLGGQYLHFVWASPLILASVTALMCWWVMWPGVLPLCVFVFSYVLVLPSAALANAKTEAWAAASAVRSAFMTSLFESFAVVRGNSWMASSVRRVLALRRAEAKAADSVTIARIAMAAVSILATEAATFSVLLGCYFHQRDRFTLDVIFPIYNILGYLRTAAFYFPLSVVNLVSLLATVDKCAVILALPLHTRAVLPLMTDDDNGDVCVVLEDVKLSEVFSGVPGYVSPSASASACASPQEGDTGRSRRASLGAFGAGGEPFCGGGDEGAANEPFACGVSENETPSPGSPNAPTPRHGYGSRRGSCSSSSSQGRRVLADAVRLDHSSLAIPGDGVTVIVGPTGCGKSTLLRMISGEVPLASGAVRTRGPTSFMGSGFVFAGSLRENIAAVGDDEPVDEERFVNAVRQSRINTSKFAPLSPVSEATVSGGEALRISLARALYSRGDVLLLDEPVSALDPDVAEEFIEECLVPLRASSGRSIIIATNNVDIIHRVGDHIVDLGVRPIRLRKNPGFYHQFSWTNVMKVSETYVVDRTSDESVPNRRDENMFGMSAYFNLTAKPSAYLDEDQNVGNQGGTRVRVDDNCVANAEVNSIQNQAVASPTDETVEKALRQWLRSQQRSIMEGKDDATNEHKTVESASSSVLPAIVYFFLSSPSAWTISALFACLWRLSTYFSSRSLSDTSAGAPFLGRFDVGEGNGIVIYITAGVSEMIFMGSCFMSLGVGCHNLSKKIFALFLRSTITPPTQAFLRERASGSLSVVLSHWLAAVEDMFFSLGMGLAFVFSFLALVATMIETLPFAAIGAAVLLLGTALIFVGYTSRKRGLVGALRQTKADLAPLSAVCARRVFDLRSLGLASYVHRRLSQRIVEATNTQYKTELWTRFAELTTDTLSAVYVLAISLYIVGSVLWARDPNTLSTSEATLLTSSLCFGGYVCFVTRFVVSCSLIEVNNVLSGIEALAIVLGVCRRLEAGEQVVGNVVGELVDVVAASNAPFVRALAVRDLSMRYSASGPLVLDRACMRLETGTVTLVMGPSGCGKSSLFLTLLGLVEPCAGDAVLVSAGSDPVVVSMMESDPEQWRSHFSWVPQEAYFFEGTLLQNLYPDEDLGEAEVAALSLERVAWLERRALFVVRRLGLRVTGRDLRGHVDDDEAVGGLFADGDGSDDGGGQSVLSLYTHVSAKGANLSAGERQRLGIARALLCGDADHDGADSCVGRGPSVLLMDEPTSFLDTRSARAVVTTIRAYARGELWADLDRETPRECDEAAEVSTLTKTHSAIDRPILDTSAPRVRSPITSSMPDVFDATLRFSCTDRALSRTAQGSSGTACFVSEMNETQAHRVPETKNDDELVFYPLDCASSNNALPRFDLNSMSSHHTAKTLSSCDEDEEDRGLKEDLLEGGKEEVLIKGRGEMKRIVLIITHQHSLRKVADQCLSMDQGRLEPTAHH